MRTVGYRSFHHGREPHGSVRAVARAAECTVLHFLESDKAVFLKSRF
jgi:hypothetical protein